MNKKMVFIVASIILASAVIASIGTAVYFEYNQKEQHQDVVVIWSDYKDEPAKQKQILYEANGGTVYTKIEGSSTVYEYNDIIYDGKSSYCKGVSQKTGEFCYMLLRDIIRVEYTK